MLKEASQIIRESTDFLRNSDGITGYHLEKDKIRTISHTTVRINYKSIKNLTVKNVQVLGKMNSLNSV